MMHDEEHAQAQSPKYVNQEPISEGSIKKIYVKILSDDPHAVNTTVPIR
jgi:hypothetical protein